MDIFDNTPLHYACSELIFDVICNIIITKSGEFDINAMNILYETPLICVLNHAYKDPALASFCIASLLLAGANPNSAGLGCLTPLMLATLYEYGGVVNMLLNAGANQYATYEADNTTIIPKGSTVLNIANDYIKDKSIAFQLMSYTN